VVFGGQKAKHPTYQINKYGAPLSKTKMAPFNKHVPQSFIASRKNDVSSIQKIKSKKPLSKKNITV
jgi:hypothetical protein